MRFFREFDRGDRSKWCPRDGRDASSIPALRALHARPPAASAPATPRSDMPFLQNLRSDYDSPWPMSVPPFKHRVYARKRTPGRTDEAHRADKLDCGRFQPSFLRSEKKAAIKNVRGVHEKSKGSAICQCRFQVLISPVPRWPNAE